MIMLGVDEVGRGCLAGPVCAGAVILDRPLRGIKDSKLLNRNQRDVWDIKIRARARTFALGWASVAEIDDLGLTAAVRLAMRRAVEQIELQYDQIIIDGNFNFLADNPKSQTLIKADSKIPAVSAASIIAKVARDNLMSEISLKYPAYGFERHVGYSTRLHLKKLQLHGVTELHRKSYRPVAALLQLPA